MIDDGEYNGEDNCGGENTLYVRVCMRTRRILVGAPNLSSFLEAAYRDDRSLLHLWGHLQPYQRTHVLHPYSRQSIHMHLAIS